MAPAMHAGVSAAPPRELALRTASSYPVECRKARIDCGTGTTGTTHRTGRSGGGRAGSVQEIFDVGRVLCRLGVPGRVARPAFSPDSRRWAAAGWDAEVRVRDVQTGCETLRFTGHVARAQS